LRDFSHLRLSLLAELAGQRQIGIPVDGVLRFCRQRVIALSADEKHRGVAAERGVQMILRNLVQLERLHAGERHQRAVGGAALQRGIGLVGTEADRRGAERRDHLGRNGIRCDQLLALEVVERADRLARMDGGIGKRQSPSGFTASNSFAVTPVS